MLPQCCQISASTNNKRQKRDGTSEEDENATIDEEDMPLDLGRPIYNEDDAFLQIKMQDVSHTTRDVKNSSEHVEESQNRKRKLEIYWKRYQSFTESPKVHFFYDTIFYATFLLIFSYMLLCDFNYYKLVEERLFLEENTTANFSQSQEGPLITVRAVQTPTFIEYLVTFWIISFFFEELNQVRTLCLRNVRKIFKDKAFFDFLLLSKIISIKTNGTMQIQLNKYLDVGWNSIDVLGIFLFFVAFTMRLISLAANENFFIAARLDLKQPYVLNIYCIFYSFNTFKINIILKINLRS